ncbi:MAG: YIP1 family protein [Defluviimonas sp.]|nr:YIP1 family protein [Defluviimonas sp.]
MQLDLKSLVSLARESVADPRGVARRLMALNLPMEARWLAMAITVALSVLLTQLALVALQVPSGGQLGGMMVSPVAAALTQLAIMLVLSAGIARIGRMLGGTGSFPDALLLVTWAEFVLVLLQVIQMVAALVFPFSSVLIGFAGIALFFWQLTQFTAALHGFTSPVKVFFGLLAGFFAAAFLLVMALSMLGIAPAEVGG